MPMTDDPGPVQMDPLEADPKVIAYRLKAIEQRANEGAKTFAEMRNSLDRITRQTEDRLDKGLEKLASSQSAELAKLTVSQANAVKEIAAANKADNTELRHDVMVQVDELKTQAAEIKEELRPKVNWLKILGMAGAALVVAVPVIWKAATMPDRSEFEATKMRTLDNAQHIHDVELEMQGLLKTMQHVEDSQKSVTDKLDQLLLRKP